MNTLPRVALVVTDAYLPGDPDADTPLLLDALRRRGVAAEATPWRDPRIDWAGFDLAVIRSPWDYVAHQAQLARWLDHVEGCTRVLNEPGLIRWNLDKRYLTELEKVGIAVVPTSYHREIAGVMGAIESHEPAAACDLAGGVVVKPSIGAGSVDTGLFRVGDPAATALAGRIIDAGGTAMVQPEIPELSAGREKAIYLVDGAFTHAIGKGALLAPGGGLIGGTYQENPAVVGATPEEIAFAEQVVRACAAAAQSAQPLYARIDVVDSAQFGLVLLEAECFEPYFNLAVAPEVTERFADAILARLG